MTALRRDFSFDDLRAPMQAANIDATVVVQARESLEETRWLLECSLQEPSIRGVVGWAPLMSEGLPRVLDEFSGEDRLVGFREIVQAKPEGYLDRAGFHRGIHQLTERGLTFDLLIYSHQLAEAVRFVDRHPQQRFVLDHAAKPNIRANGMEPWKTWLRELARRDHVCCKISGLATEAAGLEGGQAVGQSWTLDALRPYLDVCVEAFGTERLLAGSDWPVCLVASTYAQWWDALRQYFSSFSRNDIECVFGKNAVKFYRLQGAKCAQI